MATERLSHHILRVRNTEATIAFYKDRFGMTLRDTLVKGRDTLYFLGFDTSPDSTLLELQCRRDFEELCYHPSRQDGYWKIGVALQDVGRARARLVAAGVQVSQPTQFYDIGYLCHLSDPSGYYIELLQHDFIDNFRQVPAGSHPLGSSPTLGQITLRITNPKESLRFYVDGLGMKLLSRQAVEAHRFTLYFLAFTEENTPDPNVDSVKNREWLWKRPYTTLELQHSWDTDGSFNFDYGDENEPSLGFQGIRVASRKLPELIDRLRKADISLHQTSEHVSSESREIRDPDGCRIRLVEEG